MPTASLVLETLTRAKTAARWRPWPIVGLVRGSRAMAP
jgi:hypothetical protein